MANLWYCTREDVTDTLDASPSIRMYRQVDDAIEAASRDIDGDFNRVFYPTLKTVYKDWPNGQHAAPWVLWLDQDEVISVDTLISGGAAIASTDYNLEPFNVGPPYDRIEIDLASAAAYNTGSTYQRSIAITGLFGFNDVRRPSGALAAAVADATTTTVVVSDGSRVGIGSLLIVDDERMSVTDRAMTSTGLTVSSGATTASASDVTLTASGSGIMPGETLLVGSERMFVLDVVGAVASVKRAADGTVLATHSASDTIYASRSLTVERGVLGTTAASHADTTAIYTQRYPGSVSRLCRAEAINIILQESAGYARTVGSGENVRNASGAGLADARLRARQAYGRKARMRSV